MSKIFIYTEYDSDITWENVYLSTPYKDLKHFKKENPEFRPVLSYNVKDIIGIDIEQLEQELQKTREQLEIAEKVIEFYANNINWKETDRDDYEYGTAIILHSDYTVESCSWAGGKRARQYFKDKQGE